MPAREIVYRAGQELRKKRRKRLAGSGGAAELAGQFRIPGGRAPRQIRFFDIEVPYTSRGSVDWSRDYMNGVTAPMTFYGSLNYRDEAAVGDVKYTWELNRHQFLASWALEYQRTHNEEIASSIVEVILDWIAANPFCIGINWCSSLELALRILSWGIALECCQDSTAAKSARTIIARSVEEQTDYISNTLSLYSSANNHLMGELVGLLAEAAFFPDSPGAKDHANFARREIVKEASRQNFSDGVNREQAIYYHHYTLEYLMVAKSLFSRLRWEMPKMPMVLAKEMTRFVAAMVDDGGVPFEVGDRDDGRVTGLNQGCGVGIYEHLLWSGWRLFGENLFRSKASRIAQSRGASPSVDAETAFWHGDQAVIDSKEPEPENYLFPVGGYLLQRRGDYRFLFKAGPFCYPSIGAHAHCDQLSVCLRMGANDILTDSGTYCYHTDEAWRRYFRGTSAHNTVRVDGKDQAEYAGPFLWATNADARLQVVGEERFKGTHNGYLRLRDPVLHEREVEFIADAGWIITDTLKGQTSHTYEGYWNFGRGVTIERASSSGASESTAWTVLLKDKPVLELAIISGKSFGVTIRTGDMQPPAGFESRAFLDKHPIAQLCASCAAPDWRATTLLAFPGQLVSLRRAAREAGD